MGGVCPLPACCQALQFAPTAPEFVAALRERLREVAQQVDAAYPANTALTIDEDGTLISNGSQRNRCQTILPTLEALLKARLPERHLLDILKNVHYWVGYTRHFGPLSGTERKLSSPVLRYLFTVSAMPVNWVPPKQPAIRRDRLAGRSCDGSMRSTLRPPNWRQPCAM